MNIFTSEYFMKKALIEAQRAFDNDEIPVGAIIVSNHQIIAKTHNHTEKLQDVTAHAEILAITAASNYLGTKYLPDCTLYVTLEPCPMCAGALAWSQIGKIVFAASDVKKGFSLIEHQLLHPKTMIEGGVLETESQELLQRFFSGEKKVVMNDEL
ncbi:MAG: nucleoside deaminase [Saprospiraceae bacterium]|nr:nucleoside deaminase [Saprospiraceae bacterium]